MVQANSSFIILLFLKEVDKHSIQLRNNNNY
jgi:hypothetical protein